MTARISQRLQTLLLWGAASFILLNAGCSREDFTRFNLFNTRAQFVNDCCRCLADSEVNSGDDTCIEEAPDDLQCLCGLTAPQCADELLSEGTGGIRVVGSCVQLEGACYQACEGVLVYPE